MNSKDLNSAFYYNNKIIEYYSWYLTNAARFITPKMIQEVTDCGVTKKDAFCLLLENLIGLDEEKELDSWFIHEYLKPSISQCDIAKYQKNDYYKKIRPLPKKQGTWELKYESYLPYEGFIWKDLSIDDLKELPNLGFFDQEYSYLAVLQNNHEWMMVTPNEMETMEEPIHHAYGKVITFGLGLGYYAYHVSNKKDVKEVVIVELDSNVIQLFKENILPFFEHPEKIKIVQADAFDYAENNMPAAFFDTCFVDLWHDVSDGVEMYLKMKKFEKLSPHTKFDYWIETSILSYIKWNIFQQGQNETRKK